MTERFSRRYTLISSILFFWTWPLSLLFLSFFSVEVKAQDGLRNVSIVNPSPEINYSPFLCNSSSNEPNCGSGGWQTLEVGGLTVVSTDGPVANSVDIVPQMFFRFRAQHLSITTSSLSNASINVTVVTGNDILNAVGNSGVGSFSVVNLQDTDTTTISITYIPGAIPSRLDIGSITITVRNDSTSTSFLPTQTLPPSISLPSILSPSSTSSSAATNTGGTGNSEPKKKLVANAVGLTIGLGLGLTAAACAIYMVWRRRKRSQGEEGPSTEDWSREQPSLAGRHSMSSYRSPRTTKDYTDTRWLR